jgi:penicillin-binding protein 1A
MKKIIKMLPSRKKPFFLLKVLALLAVLGGVSGVLLVASVLYYFSTQVPDYRHLAEYKPELITKVYDRNGEVMAEYTKQRRIYVPVDDIPLEVKQAFMAAEDADFYEHNGFDLKGIIRAALVNAFTSRKQGASTITQQVAKTFLLTRERTYTRKIKELILAYRMEKAFSKDKILELYLNQIYLGRGAYGVAAAAVTYFDKDLTELSIGERAILAGLPKAPSYYDPVKNPRVARWRRDVILARMEAESFITAEERDLEIEKDIEINRTYLVGGKAPHFSEHVRRYIVENYSSDALYKGGLSVRTTLDARMQKAAEEAVYQGLRGYDRRHGFRGAVAHINLLLNWPERLKKESEAWKARRVIGELAVVLKIDDEANVATIGLTDESEGILNLQTVSWARKYIDANKLGPRIKHVNEVVKVGDVVFVKPFSETAEGQVYVADAKNPQLPNHLYSLEQVPKIQGALVAIDVQTGAVRAMVGGLGDGTGFNRAVQAKRQVGSTIKPFVYALALENGYTPASIILDAPVVLRTGEMNEAWKPSNYSQKVYGPSTLRRGLEKSRNLMTIRLSRDVGIGNFINYAKKFVIAEGMKRDLSTALGSSSVTLLDITSAYGVFANKGYRVDPYFIDEIQDATGSSIYTDKPQCLECFGEEATDTVAPPSIMSKSEKVMPEEVAYQMTSLLQGIVQNGTAWRAKAVGRPVGAKTGTTFPLESTRAPPELPGFIAASVWIKFWY